MLIKLSFHIYGWKSAEVEWANLRAVNCEEFAVALATHASSSQLSVIGGALCRRLVLRFVLWVWSFAETRYSPPSPPRRFCLYRPLSATGTNLISENVMTDSKKSCINLNQRVPGLVYFPFAFWNLRGLFAVYQFRVLPYPDPTVAKTVRVIRNLKSCPT